MTSFKISYCLTIILMASSNVMGQTNNQLVRLAVIEVDTNQVESYNAFLKEEVEASIENEPGVLTLFAIAEKENPERITLFETYADTDQYRAHLQTPHFLKYKQGTALMVEHLSLIETTTVLYVRREGISKANHDEFVVRLVKLEIESSEVDNFNRLAKNVMLPGLETEPEVLLMYVVAEKQKPTRISILEVYANSAAYEKHLNTSHYLKYEAESMNMIKAVELIDVHPIALGSKPQK